MKRTSVRKGTGKLQDTSTVSEAYTDGPIATGEVREVLPGSTLERGMHAEKRQELGRPRGFPN
jgi:hypothetical protein